MTIATSRTLLVPYTEQLQHDFIKLNCCPINRAEMNGPHSIASAKQLFQEILQDNAGFCRAIIHNQTREYLGHVFISSEEGKHELGFILDKEYWNQGFASEVLKPFFNLVCFEERLTNVFATVNVGHNPSIKLLEKLGFVFKETKQDQFGPYHEYRYTAYCDVTFYEAVAQTA
ncbi:acetyltransferase [Vibrio sp. HI00D65]|uniref:GNAT family N-acetyltransferase n=1 Tax=Vibrio sp. HI00D65 TaxID=1822216 RepID=UPI0007B7CEB2|nr:GNAT family N-acetyltransferase [Vibrio sp. HI00D65]KZX62696.1 acetyltransferase [Vibrio sp. HI00D65]|tara:strand:+ start:547 stop:1065 length:519 start_codon:yes stop_codon:yes gene_type:complete